MAARTTSSVISMEGLIEALKLKIIEILNLPNITPEDIPVDGQLVGGELGIDSIDTLELVIMLKNDYGVVINNKEMGFKVFASLRCMASYIMEKSPRYAG
jgi:acyl carrier protein